MNQKQAESEMKYRLIKILLAAMETEGLNSGSEKEVIQLYHNRLGFRLILFRLLKLDLTT